MRLLTTVNSADYIDNKVRGMSSRMKAGVKGHKKLLFLILCRHAAKLIKVSTVKTVAKESQMKKFALVALFVIAAFGVASAATTGSIGLSGTVAQMMSVSLSASTYSDSDLNQDGETWPIGTATFISNYNNYTIRAYSTNASNLKATIDTVTYTLPYTFVLGDSTDGYVFGTSDTAGVTLGDSSSKNSKSYTTRTPKTGITYDMKVIVAGSGTALWEPGTYTDTIYFEIVHP